MFWIIAMVDILPVGSFGFSFFNGNVCAPLLDLVDNSLMNDWFKLPGKVDLSVSTWLNLCPVFRQKIIGTAAAPVHDVLVLTLKQKIAEKSLKNWFDINLASLFPFPVCQVKIVVYVGLTEGRVPQNCVEKWFSRQQGVFEQGFQPWYKFIPGK